MIIPRSIASIGLGFGSYAEATLGFITQQAYDITSYWGGAGNYREYKRKKPKVREVKRIIQEVAKEVETQIPTRIIIKSLDIDRIIALIQYDGKIQAQKFIRASIERKIRQDQDDEDLILLLCF